MPCFIQFRTGIINNTNCQVLCEVLKAAFNITLVLSECSSKKAVNSCSGMVKTCCQIIKFESKAEYRLSEDVITPIAHFMVNLPKECLEHLCPLVGSDSKELIMDHQRFYQVGFESSYKFNFSKETLFFLLSTEFSFVLFLFQPFLIIILK